MLNRKECVIMVFSFLDRSFGRPLHPPKLFYFSVSIRLVPVVSFVDNTNISCLYYADAIMFRYAPKPDDEVAFLSFEHDIGSVFAKALLCIELGRIREADEVLIALDRSHVISTLKEYPNLITDWKCRDLLLQRLAKRSIWIVNDVFIALISESQVSVAEAIRIYFESSCFIEASTEAATSLQHSFLDKCVNIVKVDESNAQVAAALLPLLVDSLMSLDTSSEADVHHVDGDAKSFGRKFVDSSIMTELLPKEYPITALRRLVALEKLLCSQVNIDEDVLLNSMDRLQEGHPSELCVRLLLLGRLGRTLEGIRLCLQHAPHIALQYCSVHSKNVKIRAL